MRIAVMGGGPGGLYFSALAQQLAAVTGQHHEITVWERNAPDDTFGFGVVFSDETLGGIEHADPVVFEQMRAEFAIWDDIDVHVKGEVVTSGGHAFAAMSRRRLLEILQARCLDLGVDLRFRTPAPDVAELAASYDLVVACDGLNSVVRARYADTFRPTLDVRDCRYMWLGTDKVFDAFTFHIRETPYGVMQIHAYPYDATGSTFIVEMTSEVWRRAGFEEYADREWAPGESDEKSIALVRELFADVLDPSTGSGQAAVIGNNSRWISFTTVRNESWVHDNVVLLGDAAHTAHFSIGSGTKLAMEDSLALAACLHEEPTVADALATYDEERRAVVLSTQRAAQASLEWFENLGQYVHQEPTQFAFNIMTRSRRVTYDNLRVRDPGFIARCESWFAANGGGRLDTPPMFQPVTLRAATGPGLTLGNRVIVSAMDQYVAVDGLPTDFHLLHLGGKALGGAGLVMTEMICTSPEGRITLGCGGLWTDEQRDGWARIVDVVHGQSSAAIGCQLGHSGAKGSTKLMWEGMDDPLPSGNWPVAAASPVPYSPDNQTPRELDRAGLDAIRDEFVASARRAAEAGFDLLEAALCPRLPAVRLPVAGDQPAYRRVRRRRRRPAPVPPRGLARDPRGLAVGQAHDRTDLGDRLGRGRPVAGGRARRGGRLRRGGGRRDRRLDRPGDQGRAAGVRPQLPDAVRRRDPQPARGADDRGRRDLVVRRRELDPDGRPRRPLCTRPGPPLRPDVDPARRRRAGLRRAGRGVADAVACRPAQAADRSLGRPQAAAGADQVSRVRHRAPSVAAKHHRLADRGRDRPPARRQVDHVGPAPPRP